MKRVLSLIIAATLAISLAACGSLSTNGDNNQQEADGQTASIAETVLVDEGGVKITAKSLNTDELLIGAEIKLLIENNTEKNLTFQCHNASVNGYMVEPMMSVDVAAGKKANDALIFASSDLEACGISTIADMEFSFRIFTTEEWETFLDTPQIQLKTSVAETYEYTFDDSGELAYEGNDVKVVIKEHTEENSILGPGITVYIENNSDKDITVQVRDVSVNGFMVDAIFSSEVTAGKHAVDTILFPSSELEENEITEMKKVELSFHIFDTSSWDTIVDTDVVTIEF